MLNMTHDAAVLTHTTKRKGIPAGVWYTLAVFGFAVIVVLVQLALYTQRREPRDARAIVERELRLNTLLPGERVLRSVPVYRRSGVDYYRQTRGLLVLTDRRLVYLGAPPRDITAPSDQAPSFDQRVFPIDTMVHIEGSFAVLGLTHALYISAPHGDLKIGIPSGHWPKAQAMRRDWENRHRHLRALGVWAGRVRDARLQLRRELEAYRRQPVYHVVRAGDALSSISSWYEVPSDKIRSLNGIVGNKIKVGQKLLIRGGS